MRLPKEGAFDILMKILSRSRYTNAILRRWWILRGEKSRVEGPSRLIDTLISDSLHAHSVLLIIKLDCLGEENWF